MGRPLEPLACAVCRVTPPQVSAPAALPSSSPPRAAQIVVGLQIHPHFRRGGCTRFQMVHDRTNNLWRSAMRSGILTVGRLTILFACVLSGSALAQSCGPSRINFSMYLVSKPQ